MYSIGDQIEDVNRKMLGKILAENDFVAVYFCKFFDPAPIYFNSLFLFLCAGRHSFLVLFLDSDVCGTCQDVLEGLERIDGETDELDINFVKINDPKYAKKYGVSKLPALVYFRKKFPSIYRGEFSKKYRLCY